MTTLYLERPGRSPNCENCEAIKKGDQEGTCLVCGAVWSLERTNVPHHFAGETNLETMAGSPYRAAYSFRVF